MNIAQPRTLRAQHQRILTFCTAKVFALVVICAFLLCSATATSYADEVFKWTDAKGRTHYGSKPPDGAGDAHKVQGPRLSRYSSDKVLKAYRNITSSALASGKMSTEVIKAPSKPISEIRLEQGNLDLFRDDAKDIVSLSVEVKNTGGQTAEHVRVSFAFADGKLIPGVGPETVPAGETVMFSVAQDQLPITFAGKAKDTPTDPNVLIEHR